MRIGILHGYELAGSGSNEYTRYLARALCRAGHDVEILCREPRPESVPDPGGPGRQRVHVLPDAPVRPVYLTDKQRAGNVKSFLELTDDELRDYHDVTVRAARAVLQDHPVDLLHVNHLVWQPCVAADLDHPYVVYPHGSSIEYTVRKDPRYAEAARHGLVHARGLISGSREVLERIYELYPDHRAALAQKSAVVGVGVDTALFRPVARGARRDAVARARGAYGGKTAGQEADLRARLDRREIGAVTDYREAYDHAQPDARLDEKFDRIPWDDGKVLLFVGALTAGKGVQSVIAALPRVLARHPDAHLVVVGSGAYREVLEALVHAAARADQELFEQLARRGFDLDRSDLAGPWNDVGGDVPHAPGLEDHVHFLGRLDHDLLRHVFPCADLAVFPSVVPEAYPLVLMEALSNGVLPVVSDFAGFRDGLDALEPLLGRELVDRMRLPVEPRGRVEGIADRIVALLDAPADAARLRAIAVEHFDWSVRAREMADAYEMFASRKA